MPTSPDQAADRMRLLVRRSARVMRAAARAGVAAARDGAVVPHAPVLDEVVLPADPAVPSTPRTWNGETPARVSQIQAAVYGEALPDPNAAGMTIPLLIDYPIAPRPRWGYSAATPVHRRLDALLGRERAGYEGVLDRLIQLRDRLAAIPIEPRDDDPLGPAWANPYFSGLDAAALYTMLVIHNPARYIEIGSGHSTRFARRAITDHGLRTRIVSIDPEPRAECDQLCDEVVRRRFEEMTPEEFSDLGIGAEDLLFLDGSHRCFENSDVTVFFLDVLPELAVGTLVHVHDIALPLDYPPEWTHRLYSEQYLLAAWLLAEGSHLRTELAVAWIANTADLRERVEVAFHDTPLATVSWHGGSFWARRT